MMNYEVFKEIVEQRMMSELPEGFEDYTIKVSSVSKINRKEDGLQLIPPKSGDMRIIPSISLEKIYRNYQMGEDLQEILQKATCNLVEASLAAPQHIDKQIFENIKDNVVMMLINTEQNKEFLKKVPHRELYDLALIYRVVADFGDNSIHSAVVYNKLAERSGMTEQDLYKAAMENTRRMYPPVIKGMHETICGVLGMEMDMADENALIEIPENEVMYVITNAAGINGATSMLYEDVLHALAEKLGTDLYILPSSVHEVIAVSAELEEPNELAKMVTEINMSQVELADRLSNQVYHYDKDLRKITLATDTPNKRLDEHVAEPVYAYETKQSR